MLEELTEECVHFYEIWIWRIRTYAREESPWMGAFTGVDN